MLHPETKASKVKGRKFCLELLNRSDICRSTKEKINNRYKDLQKRVSQKVYYHKIGRPAKYYIYKTLESQTRINFFSSCTNITN